MKKKLFIVIALMILICIVILLSYQFSKKSFDDILGVNEAFITKVHMINGTNGYRVETQDKDKIKELINLMKDRYYRKAFIQTKKVGYSYSYSFYKDKEEILSITGSGSEVLINGTYYHVSKEVVTDSLVDWFNLLYYK